MSNLCEQEMKEKLIYELMTSVKRNSVHSACIDAFESLLNEIEDFKLIRIVIANMDKAIEECMLIFKEVDKLDSQSVKSRILTYEFIRPERFFGPTVKAVNQYIYLNAAINAKFYYNREDRGAKKWDIGNTNRLGIVWKYQHYEIGDPWVDVMLSKFSMNDPEKLPIKNSIDLDSSIQDSNEISSIMPYTLDEYIKKMQEECRKVILLWNYCPSIFKAVLQTKRRNLGLDTNSQRF